MPGQQFIKPMRGMGGDAREDVGEPSLRIDVVELGGRDQSVNGSGATTSFVRAGEGPILSFQGDGPQLAFGGIVKGYGAREAAFPTGIRALVKACNGYRDGGRREHETAAGRLIDELRARVVTWPPLRLARLRREHGSVDIVQARWLPKKRWEESWRSSAWIFIARSRRRRSCRTGKSSGSNGSI